MALERKVIVNGVVMGYHEITAINHEVGTKTEVTVCSWKDRSYRQLGYSPDGTTSITLPYDSTLDEEACYAKVAASGEFAEYHDPIDDVLAILTDEQAVQVPDAYPVWRTGASYHVGERIRYQGEIYRVLQDHVSQASWTPVDATSLFAKVLGGQQGSDEPETGECPEWEQPDSTNPYMKGDRVGYNGDIWESDVDNNVWAPGVYGWTKVSQ
jgi:chitodextrinase